jgi:hypothetical protein
MIAFWGQEGIHDWNYLLGRWGLLAYDRTFSAVLVALAHLVSVVSFVLILGMIYRMARINGARR